MPLHQPRHRTGYEVAAINTETGERIFVGIIRGSRSRNNLRAVIFRELENGDTRLDRVNKLTGCREWRWLKLASEGCAGYRTTADDSKTPWVLRFSGRTALEVDQAGQGRSIYSDDAKVKL